MPCSHTGTGSTIPSLEQRRQRRWRWANRYSNHSTICAPGWPRSKDGTMNIQQAFPSKFLKVADLAGNRPVVTIAHVTMEEIGDDSRGPRPVCYFIGKEKGL